MFRINDLAQQPLPPSNLSTVSATNDYSKTRIDEGRSTSWSGRATIPDGDAFSSDCLRPPMNAMQLDSQKNRSKSTSCIYHRLSYLK